MFKVICGNLYSPEDMKKFLIDLGFEDPLEIMQLISKRGRGLIGSLRIMYVRL